MYLSSLNGLLKYCNIIRVLVKPRKNSIFLKNGKTIISVIVQVENMEFFYILDDKANFTVGIVSQNIVTQSNFIEFRDSRNFTFCEAPGVG